MALSLAGTTRAALWMTVAIVFFAAMTVLLRMLTGTIPVHEMIFVRGVVSMILLTPMFRRHGLRVLATGRFGLLMGRGALTSLGLVTWIYALGYIPLAEAVSLHFTLPLFGILLAIVFLHERIDSYRWIATATGFLGVLVILRPGAEAFNVVSLVVLLSALCYGGTGVVTKVLVRTESSAAIVFYVSAFTAVVFAAPCVFRWTAPTAAEWVMLLAIGAFNVTGQSCLNRALSTADASFVLPFDFLRLPLTAVAAFFLFDEVPDVWTVVGATIIFGATYYVTWRERHGP